jgi:hypothetical protein
MKALEFLEEVYGEDEGWIDLPAKVQGRWIPFYTEWPSNGIAARRIKASLRDAEDLYFSVVQFAEQGRRIEDAKACRWLFADLDHVDPSTCIRAGLTPTLCWQSSPGRFQALWRMTRHVKPQSLERLNRMLTYAVGADKGGWDLTQVLRVPGTRNHKYPGAPRVKLLFADGPEYQPKALMRKLRAMVPDQQVESIAREYEGNRVWKLSKRAKALLRTPPDQVVTGERSDRLWELECLLVEARVPEEAMFDLIWPCAWNKHAEVHTGEQQLRREIKRAIRHVLAQSPRVEGSVSESAVDDVVKEEVRAEDELVDDGEFTVDRSFNPVSYAAFMSQPFPSPRWLVEDIWTAESHGIIGGEPKTSKSTLALALGLSVASGRPFLGRFPVHTTGPVLVVQEENSDWVMQDRIARIASSYGLIPKDARRSTDVRDPGLIGGSRVIELSFPHDLEFFLVNHAGLDLTAEDHQEALIADIEKIQPVLLILDPLYLMLGSANENESHQLRPTLSWLLKLRYNYKLALCVVHHFRKQTQGMGVAVRAGQRLMGNATLHGWVESSLYMEVGESDDLDPKVLPVRVTPEMRNMPPRPVMDILLRMGDPGDLEFEAQVQGVDPGSDVLRVVGEDGCTLRQLAEALGVDKRTARKRAESVGCRVYKKSARGTLRVSPPSLGGEE